MNVYLVEDDSLKAGRLQSYLTENFPSSLVQVFGSFQSGLRAIQSLPPDLVLLDMTLPTFDRTSTDREGRLRPLGGYDLMKKMVLHHMKVPVVVVTQLETFGEGPDKVTFKEMTERCRREFPDIFVGSVYFRQSEATWRDELSELIKQVEAGKND